MRERLDIDQLILSPMRPSGVVVAPDDALVMLVCDHGLDVLSPVVCRPAETAGYYEILSGVRIWRTIQAAGLHQAPVVIRDAVDDAQARAMVERDFADGGGEGTNPVAQARLFHRLCREGVSKAAIGRRFGVPRTEVSHRVRLLTLDPEVIRALEAGRIRENHARRLIPLDRDVQRALLAAVLQEGLTVAALDTRIAEHRQGTADSAPRSPASTEAAAGRPADKPVEVQRLEAELTACVGSPVSIDGEPHGRGGTLSIRYADLDVLDGILERLGYRRSEF